jgi:hypothetical protein
VIYYANFVEAQGSENFLSLPEKEPSQNDSILTTDKPELFQGLIARSSPLTPTPFGNRLDPRKNVVSISVHL